MYVKEMLKETLNEAFPYVSLTDFVYLRFAIEFFKRNSVIILYSNFLSILSTKNIFFWFPFL